MFGILYVYGEREWILLFESFFYTTRTPLTLNESVSLVEILVVHVSEILSSFIFFFLKP